MSDTQTLQTLYEADDLVIGNWNNVCLAVWRARPTLRSANELKRQYLALAKQHANGFISFGVIEADLPNPEEAERKAISAAMDAVEDKLNAAAVTLEGTGFTAAATRAVLASMSLFTRSRFPRKFFANVTEAAVWTAPFVRDGVDGRASATDLTKAFTDFRVRVRTR